MSKKQAIHLCEEGLFNRVGEGNRPSCGKWTDLYDGAVLFLCEDCLEKSVEEAIYEPHSPSVI